jgi:hypothetical protein
MAKRRKARKSGTRKHARKHARKRTENPSKKHRARKRNPRRGYAASNGRGSKMRTYRIKRRGRPAFHVRGFSAHRRKNPGVAGFIAAGIALGAGFAVSVISAYAIDILLPTQSALVQNGVLLTIAAGSVYFISNPAVAAGVATGLLLVPLAKAFYSAFPSLANPTPLGGSTAVLNSAPIPAVAAPASVSANVSLSALHGRKLGALHRSGSYGALHMQHAAGFNKRESNKRLGSLHMSGVQNTGYSLPSVRGGLRMARGASQ